MEWDSLVTAIQSLGFPIACVVAMFLMWQKEVNSHKEEMLEMRNSIETQNKATIEALNNNTIMLNKIMVKLGEIDDDGK